MGIMINYEYLGHIRKIHKNIAFCTGCFDILQPGHVIFFKQCKQFADILVVGIGADSTVRKLKGQGRPVNNQQNRLFLISSLQDVDYAILNDEDVKPGKIDFYNIIKVLKPDIFVLNDDDSGLKEKVELCNKFNIQLKLVSRIVPDYLKAISSTEIIKKIERLYDI